jgi:signal transduction histidine kinase
VNLERRTRWVYAVLAAVWLILVVWQVIEHNRVQQAARQALIDRAKDISNTVGLVLRSQRRFGIISKDRLESALGSLINPGELSAVALLNDLGDVVASAGSPIELTTRGLDPTREYWGHRTVTLMNLVDLGTNVTAEAEGPRPTLVLPNSEMPGPFGTNRPAGPPPGPPPGAAPGGDPSATNLVAASGEGREGEPPGRPRGWRNRGGPEGRPPFGRPFWMSEAQYKTALQQKGVHSFLLVLSTQSVQVTARQDLWLRSIISVLAAVSVGGLGLAWQNLARSSELEVRLVRASELNARLRDMNLAAAGLAHETKNPLNIIRGLAQMITKQVGASPELQRQSDGIIAQTDRVTAQLNEFINYSRPREVRRTAVDLNSVTNEVVRALGFDLEEKGIRLQVAPGLPTVEADEQLLRQALFNLLLNAIQAVGQGGEVQVGAEKSSATEVQLDIRDNGPGVPVEQRQEIFKPYFTTTERGTGLGLAVVHQIVLAHGWEVVCLANEPRGALFRLSHLRLAAGA